MAIPNPGTVPECAVGPCRQTATSCVHIPECAPYPSFMLRLCDDCFRIYGTILSLWPTYPTQINPFPWNDPHFGSYETKPERTPTRSPYVMTGRVKIGNYDLPASISVEVDGKEYTPSLINDAIAECDQVIAVCEGILKEEGYDRVTWRPRTEENGDVYDIATCSLPEKPEHKAGWLPGDE